MLSHRVRVSVVEPGTVDTKLITHVREDIQQAATRQTASIEPLRPDDIAFGRGNGAAPSAGAGGHNHATCLGVVLSGSRRERAPEVLVAAGLGLIGSAIWTSREAM
jgi:NAD(P)-dependent dehydrogenase (short-subunit alcohol dehydrogenase family)